MPILRFLAKMQRKTLASNGLWIVSSIILIALLLKGRLIDSHVSSEKTEFSFQNTKYIPLDLGTINEGETITKTLVLSNRSKFTVNITQILKSCACTSVLLDHNEVPSNGSAKLTLQWNTSGRKGLNGGYVTIPWRYIGQAGAGEFKVGFQERILTIADVEPTNLDFGACSKDASVSTQTIHVHHGDSSINWSSISIKTSEALISEKIVKQDGGDFDVVTSFAVPQLDEGISRDDIHISLLNDENRLVKEYLVPATIRVLSSISLKPESIYFGVTLKCEKVKKELVISSDKNIHLISLSSTVPSVSCKILETSDKKIRLECCLQDSQSGNKCGKLYLKLRDDTGPKTFAIPLIALVI